jgi:hypothetical protein
VNVTVPVGIKAFEEVTAAVKVTLEFFAGEVVDGVNVAFTGAGVTVKDSVNGEAAA